MAAQSSTIEFYEKHPLMEFFVGARRFVPRIPINLQVDYDDGLWIVCLPFVDAQGSSIDYHEAKLKLFEYIDFLWSEYVSCPEEELGETGRMQRELLQEMFKAC
ncbi:hypothetical protein [Methanothrix soehngenii]|uniref:hypothetical protein n=1 Tax=Methanothrix soehngenii TaxID=2223 RepID=UPI002FD962CA